MNQVTYDLTCIHLTEDKETSYTCTIFRDDTIDHVKSKISTLFTNKNIDEYYLFVKQKITLNPYDSYKLLSFQNTRPITYETFSAFCLNHQLKLPKKKEAYELDDFLELETDVLSSVPVGIVHETPFVVDPFQNTFNQQEDSGTTSKSLWISLADPVQNTIYVCFATDVYEYARKKELEISKVFNVYYPYLFKEDRLLPARFIQNYVSPYQEYNSLLDFHHSIYKPDAIVSDGIVSLYFVMYTLQPFQFPVDIFFKLFQSSSECPYIKLNGIKTNENIYRFYCDQISENGALIPSLRKKTILKYAHDINKNSISYLFPGDIPLFLNLDKKGHLYFKLEQIPFMSVEMIEHFLQKTIQSFMEKLFEYFDPSRKIFTPFENLSQPNIAILDMKYRCNYKKEGKINIKKYMSCFSPLFNFIHEKENIVLRYKRVSNYNESQSKDAYLIEAFNQNIPIEEIIHVFSSNFMKQDEKAAADYVNNFFSTIEIEKKQNNLKRVKINPGFLVEIDKKELLEVTVHSIDHIQYIPFIKLYLTNLVLISQGVISDEGRCKKIKDIVIKEIKLAPQEDFDMDDFEIEEMPDISLDSPSMAPNMSPSMAPGLSPEMDSPDFSLDLPEDSPKEPQKEPIMDSPEIESPDMDSPELDSPSLSPGSFKNLPVASVPLDLSQPNVPLDSPEDSQEDSKEDSPEDSKEDSPLGTPESVDDTNDKPAEDSHDSQDDSISLNSVSLEAPSNNGSLESPSNSASLESPSNNVSLEAPSNNGTKNGAKNTKGGTVLLQDKMYDMFIYDENDPYTLQKRFKRDPVREAKIADHYRAFQDQACTLIKKENEICKGYIIELNGKEMKELYPGELTRIEYFDKPGNSYDGYTYIPEPKEWTDHPVIQFVKKVYATVAYGWNHKQDDKDEMYIYDNHNELKARYNGKYYVRLDENEELTKVQFQPVNPFLKRLQEREPDLFTKTDKIHNQYSRMCLWSEKRQPVILTKEEKERIDAISPGSYDSVIEYGTDPAKPYYYICPRYWDLKHSIPLTADKVDKDKLISRDATDEEKQRGIQSRYILEMAKPGDKPVYQTRPGFLTKKNPQGKYIPCCFMSKPKKDKPDAQELRIQEALQYYKRKPEETEDKEASSDYIQRGDKFPLPDNRKGHLTLILEKFFDLKFIDCYSQYQKRKLKLNYPCLLRQGVKEEQPFLSALSFLYFKKSVPLAKFIKVLLDKITIDTIQSFHNGGIVQAFSKNYETQDTSAYKSTELYKKMDPESMKRIVNGYENFRKYLASNDYIDYTYLWDIVTSVLFKKRINMIILKEGMDDPTNNLQIVCPTTAHALYLFNDSYPSIMIYQKGDLFEPLFVFKKTEEDELTLPFFDLKDNLPSVNDVLRKIYERVGPSCKEKTVHASYTFRENLYLHELLDELKKTQYKVVKQIMNIDGRIFGVLVKKDTTFFVPCRPSAVSGDYELLDDTIWKDYRTTMSCLQKLATETKIPCAPKIRVLENNMVVGILTETNQFIPLKEPEENKIMDGLPTIDEENRMKVDRQIQKGKLDPKEKVIQSLKIEQMFYSAFFNTLKVELNDSSNLMLRKKIEQAIQVKDMKKMNELFEPLIEQLFVFVDEYAIDVYELTHVNICKSKEPYCGELEDEGKLLIPKENLFHQGDNSVAYPKRFIDDLMMNVHIQRIMFEEIHSTLYYTDRYQLTDREILLLESELNTYLEKEPKHKIKSVIYPMLEDVQPNKIMEYIEMVEPKEEPEKIFFTAKNEFELSDESDNEDSDDETEPTTVNPLKPESITSDTVKPVTKPATVMPSTVKPLSVNPLKPVSESDSDESDESVKVPKIVPEKSLLFEESDESDESDEEPLNPATKAATVKPATKPMVKPGVLKPKPEPVRKASKLVSKIAGPKALKPATEKPATEKPATNDVAKPVVKPSLLKPIAAKIESDSEEDSDESEEEPEKVPVKVPRKVPIGTSLNFLPDLEPKPKKLIQMKKLQDDILPCIKTFYFKKNSKWKDYFPPRTIGYRIMKGDTYDTAEIDIKCNYTMALQILRDYDEKYKDLTIRELKDILIEGYTKVSKIIPLEKKFIKEKKRYKRFVDIQMEQYPFTQLDLLILMIQCALPIVVFIQAKNKLKLITYHTDDTFKYYIKMKKKDTFMLFIYDHVFKIERKDMNALYEAERDNVYLNDEEQLKAFFQKY